MTTSYKRNRFFIGILALFAASLLTASLLTACGKKGEEEFKKGQASYVAQDYKTALTQFALAANQGHAEAQYYIGLCYEDGKGVEADKSEAAKWYKQAAENGYAEAQFRLGNILYSGEGAPLDMYAAIEWYRKAAKQGNADAQGRLDSLKDVVDLLESAGKGDVNAMFEIATAHSTGKGEIQKDQTEAVKWFKKAAEKGNAQAMYNLFVCYNNGDGMSMDGKDAFQWCLKAAEKGYAPAQYQIGMIYYGNISKLGYSEKSAIYDYLPKKNLEEAVNWLSKAVEQDYPPALEAEVALSLGWLKKQIDAIKKGDAEAMLLLGKA